VPRKVSATMSERPAYIPDLQESPQIPFAATPDRPTPGEKLRQASIAGYLDTIKRRMAE